MISYQDFEKVEIIVGKILASEDLPETDKLVKLLVDFNEGEPRQIISGIKSYFPNPEVLVGKKCMFVTNLEPRVIKGYESRGMLFALSDSNGAFSLLEPNESIPIGTRAK